tara:strand:+ start:51 stop:1052 length:1002 start_codon:yes stop_codon:yes gene_type:complete
MEKVKKLVGISSFCDTEEKIRVLISNLVKLRDLEVDILLFTPLSLPQKVYDLCTSIIISSENPVLKFPERGQSFWRQTTYKSDKIKFIIIKEDYGWASINQLKRLAQYAYNLDYEAYHLMIYDLNITPDIESEIRTNTTSSFYPHYKPSTQLTSPVGGMFSTFTPVTINIFGSVINKSSYKNSPSAEDYLFNLNKSSLNLPISNILTEDLVCADDKIYENINMSFIKDLNLFINTVDYLGIYFYNIKGSKSILIKVNNQEHIKTISSTTSSFFISDILLSEIKSISISIDGEVKDYSSYLPQNSKIIYRFKVNENKDMNYVKDFIQSHKINFN